MFFIMMGPSARASKFNSHIYQTNLRMSLKNKFRQDHGSLR